MEHLNFLNTLLGFLCALAVGAACLGYWRKSLVQSAGEITDRQDKTIKTLREQMDQMQKMLSLQDRRLNRAEMEAHRKDRMLLNARQEISYFEDMLAVLLPVLATLAPDDKKRVDNIFVQLREFRIRTAHEQMEWEETRDSLSAYMDGVTQGDIK